MSQSTADATFRHTILYVDDEVHNLTVFEVAFQDDYDVRIAGSAREAMEILRDHEVHLVVADQRMPEMTGVQFLEIVVEEYPDIVRMILTGYTDIDAIIQAINAGRVYQYATKPWEEEQLKVVIDRALESWDLRRRNEGLLEELRRRSSREAELREAFQRYVPSQVVDDLLDHGKQTRFLGETRIVVLLVADLQGFTSRGMEFEASRVPAALNSFFHAMTQVISRRKGNVNKLLGDGLLALFGAPVSSLGNAENAVHAALEMRDLFTDSMRGELREILGPSAEALELGVVVHLGEVMAGNLGPDNRTEYSVIGDALDTAFLLDRRADRGRGEIVISREVHRQTKDLVRVEKLEEEAPIELWRVLGKVGS